ncbi:MAG: neuraminidase-like domain-containing protein [Desulfobacteraceae bacterium]|nr:neuraminidase-like domain-containing protein [Desulfobacteraceae bacterium]
MAPQSPLAMADELTLANVTRLFGLVTLGRGLRLSPADLLGWIGLLGNPLAQADFTARAQALLTFAEQLDGARQSGIGLDELYYLLRHELRGEFEDAEARTLASLVELRDLLQRSAPPTDDPSQGTAPGPDPLAELLVSHLSSLLGLEAPVMRYLLDHIRMSSQPGTQRAALEVLLDPALLASDAAQALDPAQFSDQIRTLLRLDKVARLLRGSGLISTQLAWIDGGAWEVLNFNQLPAAAQEPPVPIGAWLALVELIQLKDRVAGGAGTLQAITDIFQRHSATTLNDIALVLAQAYQLKTSEVQAACDFLHLRFTAPACAPCDLRGLVEFLNLLRLLGTNVAVIQGLLAQAPSAADAMAARKLFMAQFDAETLPKRLQPISDQLRVRQRDALVSYLQWRDGLSDENALLDYFLMDVKMEPCMRTSRVKQAISAVQLFIQRCLLNLESQAPIAVAPGDINTTHWRWMKNYRVWEANRKVFLFPENWIEPDLRDDKSEIFRAFESDLMQENLDHEACRDAFRGYLEKAAEIARLTVVALWEEKLTNASYPMQPGYWDRVIQIVARDDGSPAHHYHRQLTMRNGAFSWTPWESIDGTVDSEHVFVFKLAGFVHLAYAEIAPDENKTNWKVQMAVRRKTKQGWSNVNRSKQAVTTPIVPNKDEATTCVFNLNPFTDQGRDGMHVSCYAADLGVTLTLAPASGGLTITQKYNASDPPRWQTLQARVRVLEKFVDQAGHTFYAEPRGRAGGAWIPQVVVLAAFEFKVGPYIYPGLTSLTRLNEFEVSPYEQLPWVFGLDTKAIPWPHFTQLLITVQGDPRYHSEPSQSLTIDISAMLSGTYENDLVFTVKPESNYPAPAENRLIVLHPLPGFIIYDDFSVVGTSLSAGDLEKPYMDWEYFRSGHRQLMAYSSGPVRGYLSAAAGRYFMPATQPVSGDDFVNQAYADDRFRFFFLWHQLKARVVPAGQDWIFSGIRNFDRADPSGIELDHLPVPRTPTSTPAIPLDTSHLSCLDMNLTAKDLSISFEYGRPAGSYEWEVFFHAPLLIATQLSAAQRFEEAQRWFHTIFDPTTNDPEKNEAIRYWRFPPFRQAGQGQDIESLLEELARDAGDDTQTGLQALRDEIAAWKDDPFKPHLIARFRIRAYQWAVVIKYIQNLMAWGDQLFRRDTLETINEAMQLYVLAARILGPRPASVPSCGRSPHSYLELAHTVSKLDELSNAWVALEDLAAATPLFPNQWDPSWNANGNTSDSPIANPLQGLYFCVPPNGGIEALWDTVDDRLFKIRHCMNIEGIERRLPLFEPPIDPALLVKAAAAGLDLDTVLADLAAPLPAYRFNVILPKAVEACAELKNLGAALLAALEKQDAEALALLRSVHEIGLLRLTEQIKQNQIEEARLNTEGLAESRRTAEERYRHYQLLLGRSDISVPQPGVAVSLEPIPLSLAKSGLDAEASGLGISQTEKGQLDNLGTARDMALASGIVSAGAGVAFAVGAYFDPTGTVFKVAQSVGHGLNAIAGTLNAVSAYINANATKNAIIAGYQRRRDDWIFQANLALRDLQQIDKQIAAAEIRQAIAAQELDHLKKQIDNAQQIDDFMHAKFTNQELYRWMGAQLSLLYFRTYQLVQELAKRAERAYRHELGLADSSVIQFGYWDSLKKGLLAGERLHFDLKRLEMAYLEGNRRELEITKQVSLWLLDPLALIQLKETGACDVSIPEPLFDMDFPGHYFRRLKSVSLTIPCVVGPYTSLNCTLRLKSHSYRRTARVGAGGYARAVDSQGLSIDDDRFVDSQGTIQSIAVSHGQNDSGMFELNFRDERFLPFEGAGAISTWHIELPNDFRSFDYNTISDVVLHLKYTAREDSGQFKLDAMESLKAAVNAIVSASQTTGLLRFFSLKHEFSGEWHRFLNGGPEDNNTSQTFTLGRDRWPFVFHGHAITINRLDFLWSPKEDQVLTAWPALSGIPLVVGDPIGRLKKHRTDPAWSGVTLETDAEHLDLNLSGSKTDVAPLDDVLVVCHYTLE